MLALHGAAGLVCCRPVVRLPVVGTLARVHVAQAPAGGLARRGLRCAAMAQDAGCSMNVVRRAHVLGKGATMRTTRSKPSHMYFICCTLVWTSISFYKL